MRTVDIARRAGRSLKNAKARTILTSLAIAVGAFTITISLAAGEGARQYANKLISSNVNPQALFIVRDKTLFEGGVNQASLREYSPDTGTSSTGLAIKQMTQADIEKLQSRSDIDSTSVMPTYSPQIQFLQFGDTASASKFVADITTFDPTITSEIAAGSLPPKGEQLKDNQAILPESFVSVLVDKGIVKNANQLIGKQLILTAAKSTVAPTSEEISAAFASGGQAAVQALVKPEAKQFIFEVVALSKQSATALTSTSSIQIPATAARAISEYTTQGTAQFQRYLGATALVKDGKDPTAVRDSLKNDGFYAKTAKDLQSIIFTFVNTLQGIVLGFGIVALIASIFGIINTQYISVLERTREIGLMKALGMRGRSVSRLFQFEAAWIGFLGGTIGAILAVILGLSLNPWITSVLGLGEGNYILIFQPFAIVLMIVALIVIAMLAGWFPARKAAKLDPIEALRTE